MIFVTVGSQKFHFNRILEWIDILLDKGVIDEKVFAQIGYSEYKPRNFEYKNFLDREEFVNIMNNCEIVVTHGGTGAIIGALKKKKKVITVPRLSCFDEHIDDHQLQIISEFEKMNLIISANSFEDLEEKLKIIRAVEFKEYVSNTNNIIDEIEKYIQAIQ